MIIVTYKYFAPTNWKHFSASRSVRLTFDLSKNFVFWLYKVSELYTSEVLNQNVFHLQVVTNLTLPSFLWSLRSYWQETNFRLNVIRTYKLHQGSLYWLYSMALSSLRSKYEWALVLLIKNDELLTSQWPWPLIYLPQKYKFFLISMTNASISQ